MHHGQPYNTQMEETDLLLHIEALKEYRMTKSEASFLSQLNTCVLCSAQHCRLLLKKQDSEPCP